MIKRRFYRVEHGDRDDPSSESSSSSDSEVEADSDDDVEVQPEYTHQESPSPSSGYESEDSSGNEIDAESPGPIDEDEDAIDDRQGLIGSSLSNNHSAEVLGEETKKPSVPLDLPDYVLKLKSVYKCRICPRITCLSEESLKSHLSSKRHTRSEKLLKENRLKAMLNSDGEIENQETAAEMHARIVSLAPDKSKRKNKGRQRQRKRSRTKQNEGDEVKKEKTKGSTKKISFKKQRKS